MVFSGYQLYTGFQSYWDDYIRSLEVNDTADRGDKTVNWNKLKKINSDVIGWLYCPDTVIDYAVVQGSDNSKYLYTGVDGKWAGGGTLFVDCVNENPFKEPNTIIYGHHMKDGSKFHDLDLWQDENYLKKHPTFYLYTPNQNYELTVVGCQNIEATNTTVYGIPYTNENETEDFIELVKNGSVVKTAETESMNSSNCYVTLSTCAYTFKDARTILVCRVDAVEQSISELECGKAEPDSKLQVFCRMVKEIVKEGFVDLTEQ